MERLSGLRRAQIGGQRAPHKPLLLLWLFGQLAATGPAIALCSLHHALFDCGVLGLSPELRVTVSPLYVATSQAGRAIDALADQRLLNVRPGQPTVDVIYINWHTIQVFKSHRHRAA